MSTFRSPRNYSAKKSSNAHEDYLPIFEKRQVNPSTSIDGRWSYCLKNLGTRTLRCQVFGVSWKTIENLIFGLTEGNFEFPAQFLKYWDLFTFPGQSLLRFHILLRFAEKNVKSSFYDLTTVKLGRNIHWKRQKMLCKKFCKKVLIKKVI